MSESTVKLFETITMKPLVINRIEAYNQSNKIVSKHRLNSKLQRFRVTWKDLTYMIPSNIFGRKAKIILNDVNGFFESGQITAIMGPSGCGKSSLLGCISGQKRSGLTGSITISNDRKIKFGFIVQDNYILERLTVRESLTFASKIRNGSNADHIIIVSDIIDKLMIQSCADNYLSSCSGGQIKRILIGLELVSKPDILILDEPTSGLDSVTTWQLIQTLITLTESNEPIAVVATIHQPSAKLFNLFNRVYLLSCEGQCIYNGGPEVLLSLLDAVGLKCPQFTNVSDFALEVATNDHGRTKLLALSAIVKIEAMHWPEEGYPINIDYKYNTFFDIWYLTQRSVLSLMRDPLNLGMRFFGYIMCAVVVICLYGTNVGHLSGCTQDFRIDQGQNMMERWKEIGSKLLDNIALLAFCIQIAWIGGIFPILLIFPTELNIFLQEYGNGYYSGFSYFVSQVLSDTLFNMFLPNLASIPIFLLTNQYRESIFRLFRFVLIFMLSSINSSALGFMIGSGLADFPSATAFMGMLTIVPLLLLSGVMLPIHQMSPIFYWMSFTDYQRFGFHAIVVNCYGFDRCSQTKLELNQTNWLSNIPTEKLLQIYASDKIDSDNLLEAFKSFISISQTDDNLSEIIRQLGFEESEFYFSMIMLILHIIIYRAVTYLLILRKIKSYK